MTEPKLKPCPFCGSEAWIEDWVDGCEGNYRIECSNYDCDVRTATHGTLDEAVKRWNKRVGVGEVAE